MLFWVARRVVVEVEMLVDRVELELVGCCRYCDSEAVDGIPQHRQVGFR